MTKNILKNLFVWNSLPHPTVIAVRFLKAEIDHRVVYPSHKLLICPKNVEPIFYLFTFDLRSDATLFPGFH